MEPNNQNAQPLSAPAQPSVAISSAESLLPTVKSKLEVTYLFALTITLLLIVSGATGMYYWELKQQLATDAQEQALAAVRKSGPTIPFSSRIVAPTSTAIIYKDVPFTVHWNPMRLKYGETAEMWIGYANGTKIAVDTKENLKLESGSYALTLNDEDWRFLKPKNKCDSLDIEIKIGRNEKQGPGVIGFVPQNILTTSFFVGQSTSTVLTDCIGTFEP